MDGKLIIGTVDALSEPRAFHERPWGGYTVLYEQPGIKIKTLRVDPGHEIPLQRHLYHEERWQVVHGTGKAFIKDDAQNYSCNIPLDPGTIVDIPVGRWHKIMATEEPLYFIEVQIGVIVPGGDAELA